GVAAQQTTPTPTPQRTTPTPTATPQRTTPTPTSTPQRTSPGTSTQPFVVSGCVSALPGAAAGGTVPSQSYSLGRLEYGTSGAAYDQWARTHPMGPATVAPAGRTTTAAPPQRPTEFAIGTGPNRSEERRVGKERMCRMTAEHQ